ncbi:MAG: hypothetical protein IPF87_07365 [Gemmatimonadetes bacterium]|nr:hypothetical protein [Gemmatimonadota bacterium]
MPHPSEAALIAFADDELDAGARGEVVAHLDGCGLCRHAVRDLREAMGALAVETALVDTVEPASWRDRPATLPRAAGHRLSLVGAGLPRDASRPVLTPRRSVRAARWAAALLLLAGGGAAAMTAPRWTRLLRGDAVRATTAVAATPATTSNAPVRLTAAAAVSVLPIDGAATVSLLSGAVDRDARVIVHVSDRRDVQVTVTTPTSADRVPRFLTGDGRLEVQLAGVGSVVEVDFPSSLRDARVTHDGRAIVTVRGGAILPLEAATTGVSLVARP